MKRLWIILTILALLTGSGNPIPAVAGGNIWTQCSQGMWGGNIQALAISPRYASDHTLFAGALGVFKSTDGGASWSATGLTNLDVWALALSPGYASDHTLFAGNWGGGVFKSTNGGDSWNAVNTGLTNLNVQALALSPGYPTDETLFAGTYEGVFKSTDGGASWSATGLTKYVQALAPSPGYASDGTLFAGTYGGVFKSTDGGTSWSVTGLTNRGVQALALSPGYASDHTLFAGAGTWDWSSGGVFKSTDGGASWSAMNTGLTNLNVLALTLSPGYASDHTLFAGTYGVVFKSTDGGASWRAVNTGLINLYVKALALSPGYTSDRTLFAGTLGGGVFKSTDSGASWSAVNTGLTNLNVKALVLSPGYASDHTLFAGTYGVVFKSTDGGASWRAVNTGLTNLYVWALALSPGYTSDHTLFAGTEGGVFKSTDGGASWSAMNTGLTNLNVQALALSPGYASDRTLFAGTDGWGVFKSTDGGDSWSAVNTGITKQYVYVKALALSPGYTSDRTLFAGILGGVFKSTDGGDSWSAVNTDLTNLYVQALALSPGFVTDQTLFAGTYGGVFKSTDGGASWSLTRLTNWSVLDLVLSPGYVTDQTLFAGVGIYKGGWWEGGGVFKSTDGGDSWSAMNAGLGNLSIRSLALTPTFPCILFAGTGGSSVWQYTLLPNQVYLPLIVKAYEFDRLTYHPANDFQPALSPDGQTVVFISDRDGLSDVFSIPLMGGQPVNLTQTPLAQEDTPVFAPDGSTIAFASDRTGDWDIYLMNPDGSNVRPALSGQTGTDELHPAFTPDGLALVFSSNRADGNWDIYTATVSPPLQAGGDGGGWPRLTTHPATDRFPTLSADGKTIVFRSERDGNSEIYLMDADGSNLRRVTDDPAFDGYPSIIPDGSGVMFVSDRSGQQNVYVVNWAGEGLAALEQREGWQMYTPRLSKNGRLLIYAGGPTGSILDIYQRKFASPLMLIAQRGADNLEGHCDWEAGVLAYGWIQAWQATQACPEPCPERSEGGGRGDDQYRHWAQQWVDGCIPIKTEITHVNDGLMGYAALFAYETRGGPEYLAFAQRVADYLMNTAPRTTDGTLTHDSNRVWVDTLLGTVPFLLEMSQVSGSDVYADEAISQVIKHADRLQDPMSGLYHHAWDESGNNLAGQVYWGRGNGWALLADVEVLSAMTTTHPLRSTVLDILQKQAAGLRPLQDASGLWHTVLTRSDFYLETSASALIGHAFKRGVQEEWLDEDAYAAVAQAATLGVWRQVLADGTVTNVSGPTWPMLTEGEYNARPHGSLQLYGQGVALLLESPSRGGSRAAETRGMGAMCVKLRR